jgi:tRNA(fMet)-specific endonuclease VapC
MSRILLDTSGYSAFMRGHAAVVDEVRLAREIAVNPVILGELLAGFSLGRKRQWNLDLLDRFLASPRCRIIEIDEGTAERYAAIFTSLRRRGTPIPTNDLWIAASAMQHGLRLVTLDAGFEKIPQILVSRHQP